MSKRGKRQHKAAKRRAALREAATTVSAAQDVGPAVGPAVGRDVAPTVAPAVQPPAEPPQRRRRAFPWVMAGVGAAVVLAIAVALSLRQPVDESALSASPTIAVGVPGGEVIAQATPIPSSRPTATPAATAAPTPVPPTAAPTPAATPPPQPTSAPTSQPTSAPPPPAATPAPTAVVVAVAGPDDSVAAFYRNAAAGNFDAAYSLWSSRMRAAYPRQENLDGRFAETESITFEQLFVAEQTERTATVQANFTEVYEGGGSREFVGYWRLILVDGRWLLDEPQY